VNKYVRRYVVPTLGCVAFLAVTGCSQAAAPGNVMNNTAASAPANNTDNTSNASGTGHMTNSANAPNPQKAPSTPTTSVTSASSAEELVKSIFKDQMAKDPKLQVTTDHTYSDGTHTVYAVHVYNALSDHTATIAWIDVRDDGMVRDGLARNAWGSVNQFKTQHPQ
jgi:hypothetical protein